MADKVGIVIPVYNPVESYLRTALESVRAQTFTDWSALVVDDGSTTDLSWVEAVDPRIRLVTKPNAGVSSARNFGIELLQTPLIAFLDGDDVWLPEKIERQVKEFTADPELAVCCSDYEHVDAEGCFLSGAASPFVDSVSPYQALLANCGVWIGTVMVRQNVLQHVDMFDTSLAFGEDWDLWLRIAREGFVFRVVRTVLAQYRMHGSNSSRHIDRLLQGSRIVIDRQLTYLNETGQIGLARYARRNLRRAEGHVAFQEARKSRDASKVETAKLLWVAMSLNPSRTLKDLLRVGS